LHLLHPAPASPRARRLSSRSGATRTSRVMCAALVLAAVSVVGCKNRGGSDASGDGTTPEEEEEVLSSMDDRVRCASLGPITDGIDVNNDGRADIQYHTSGDRLVCTEIDMNFDGRVDVTRFF